MLDKSIDGALLALRKQIIRSHGEGLEHVEALLALRGVRWRQVRPTQRPDRGRRGQTRRVLLEALAGGPKRLCELTAVVQAWKPELPPLLAHQRASKALRKLKEAGLVRREDRAGRYVWGLAREVGHIATPI